MTYRISAASDAADLRLNSAAWLRARRRVNIRMQKSGPSGGSLCLRYTEPKTLMSQVCRLEHPLVDHHLCEIRDAATPSSQFRLAIGRLAMLLSVRATEDLPTHSVNVRTPLADAACRRLSVRVGIVPILRAGLGMVDPLLVLLPDAEVWHLGLYRNEETAQPVSYYDRLPLGGAPDVVMLLDPMLATGGSMVLAIDRLCRWGVNDIRVVSIIASQPGIEHVTEQFPHVRIFVATIDPELDHRSYIVPGLGDAGDRIFDTQRLDVPPS